MDMPVYTFEGREHAQTESCLAAKLMKLTHLSSRHVKLLARLETNAVGLPRGHVLLTEGQPANELIILKSGWVSSGKLLKDGGSSIAQIHHPGDVVGFENIAFSSVKNTCVAESDLIACKIRTSDLNEVFSESPRLAALITALGAIEHAIISDRVMISRRNDGEMRVALFLLQTLSRLRLMNDTAQNGFMCPLRQQQIGDATGLTSVHVSRMLKRLEDGGFIRRSRQFIEITDEEGLSQMIDYVDRYQDLNLSWLPED